MYSFSNISALIHAEYPYIMTLQSWLLGGHGSIPLLMLLQNVGVVGPLLSTLPVATSGKFEATIKQ